MKEFDKVQEAEITKQVAQTYGFSRMSAAWQCIRCGARLTDNYSSGSVNERMINHSCKTAKLGRGGTSSSRN